MAMVATDINLFDSEEESLLSGVISAYFLTSKSSSSHCVTHCIRVSLAARPSAVSSLLPDKMLLTVTENEIEEYNEMVHSIFKRVQQHQCLQRIFCEKMCAVLLLECEKCCQINSHLSVEVYLF